MSAPGGGRYEALDSLRGVAACGVVFFHLHSTGIITNLPIARNGWLFVDFFFVLSGFVIAASYGEKLRRGFPLGAYAVLRVGRIYPLHLFMLLGFVALELATLFLDLGAVTERAAFSEDRTLGDLALSLSLTQIFVPASEMSWNGPSWSIAAEMWTYMLTALGLSLLKDRFRLVLIGLVLLAPFALSLLGDHHLISNGWSLLRCLYSFSIGMLAFDLHQGGYGRVQGSRATLMELAVLILGVLAICFTPRGPAYYLCPLVFALVILILAGEGGRASALLKTRPFRALGRWSYSIYMVQLLVLIVFINSLAFASVRWFGGPWLSRGFLDGQVEVPVRVIGGPAPDLVILIALGLVVAAAAVTYRLVELPFRNASRRWARRIADRPVEAAERTAPTM